MRIALISGSRSDRNALVMVEKALMSAGHNVCLVEMSDRHEDTRNRTIRAFNSGVAAMLVDKHPDIVMVHGDRYEILAAVLTANVGGYPIAHIGGGDITEGSQDDCFRHAITKLSHLHFASHQDAADRIIQMGEEPRRVYVTGCPGIDMVMATPTMGFTETMGAIGLLDSMTAKRDLKVGKCILVLFHPNTLGDTRPELEVLSVALARRTEALVLLGPNADAGSDFIRAEWKRLAATRPDTVYHDNVEPAWFYSLLKHCDVLVGNSSAGFYEAPCFGTPTIDLGDRQRGRRAWNVIGPVPFDLAQMNDAIDLGIRSRALHIQGPNPYGDGHAAPRIAEVIGKIVNPKALLRKRWNDARETAIRDHLFNHRL